MSRALHIVFVAPAYWPATAFGGPIPVMRALARELTELGHRVDVLTTTLTSPGQPSVQPAGTVELDGATVRYLATPLHYRWFGYTPSLRRELGALPRPDVVHVFGFRDYVSTATAHWCRRRGIPYVLEALGMFEPKLRKVALKRALDATLYRAVPRGAALGIATSAVEERELERVFEGGRVAVRPNGFPPPHERGTRPGPLRQRLGLDAATPLLLSVGRLASGKGLELLVRAVGELDGVHLALVGPDDGHGTTAELTRLREELGIGDRVHLLGPVDGVDELYGDADVFVLASAHENFGMVAAEAAAAGVPSVVTDRCGVSELLRDRAALVVPYEPAAVVGAVRRLLDDAGLRARLGRGGHEVARELSWPQVARRQAELYEQVT